VVTVTKLIKLTELTELIELQLLNFAYKRLLSKPYENEVTLTRQNPPLKCYQPPLTFYTIEKGFRFLIAKNLGSVG